MTITGTASTAAMLGGCPYCSSESVQIYHGGKCPKVKAIEYYPDGTVKRVEFGDGFH